MAQVKNNNSRGNSVGETNYQNKMFQGKQFETVDEAIEAGAKAYAKLAWGEIKAFMKEVEEQEGTIIADETMAKYLVESKRKTIIASMQKRESIPKAFE